MTAGPIIALKNLTKRFPGVLANDRISLEIGREIHAIVGENGAGKSTLMKMLCGLYRPDSGEIWLNGSRINLTGPRQAISLGIGMVHQHFMLVGRFTVLENIILGAEPSRGVMIDRSAARSQVQSLLEHFGFDLDLDARISDLSVGQQQRVEILKVLYRGAQVLILDEPTAVLTPQEVRDLFVNLRALRKSGKTIVFISHKLDEVLEIADQISVLRRGRLVGTVPARDATRELIAQMMVGRPVIFAADKPPTKVGDPLLELRDVCVAGKHGQPACEHISLSVRAGEIYGIAGVEGNGQAELVEAITGLRKVTQGSILIGSRNVTGQGPNDLRRHGLAHIPEDRHRRGLILAMSVLENFLLGSHKSKEMRRGIFIDFARVRQIAEEAVKRYDIRLGSLLAPAGTLSGGNQQKVILSRELGNSPRVIIAAQPMRGLDVGATEFVRSVLLSARSAGCAVLLVSADLEELLMLSDRIGVMYRGRLVAEVLREATTIAEIGQYMLGSRPGVSS